MKKELEQFYDECDLTIKDCAKTNGMNITDFDDPDYAYTLASCIRIYNQGKRLSLDSAKEFDEMKRLAEENNKMLSELLRRVSLLENKKTAKEKE